MNNFRITEKILLFVFGPLILFLFTLYFIFVYGVGMSFFGVTFEHNKSDFEIHSGKRLVKGEPVESYFYASHNNLGLVFIRFDNNGKISDDKLEFKIKEADSDIWLFSAVYKVDQFLPNEYFTFGFPVQENSKGKKYTFRLESVNGTKNNSISISNRLPLLSSYYQFDKSSVLDNPKNFVSFLELKIESVLRADNTLGRLFQVSAVWVVYFYIVIFLIVKPGVVNNVKNSVYNFVKESVIGVETYVYIGGLVVLVFFGSNFFVGVLTLIFWIWTINKLTDSYYLSKKFIFLALLLVILVIVFDIKNMTRISVDILYFTLIYFAISLASKHKHD